MLVTVIGIANAMLMSVTERFREIGTMKCLGALSSFVTQMFVLEASLMGLVGGIVGAVAGALFAIVIYTFTYGASLVFGSLPLLSVLTFAGCSIVAGVILSVIAALYLARVAAAMVPATALRSTI
ncbi:MAG: FtsX-like permease family protein [Kiritimatiellae bacterium]|nr:FtsX-like permease family protein [Kiritimatiellia bacterium]